MSFAGGASLGSILNGPSSYRDRNKPHILWRDRVGTTSLLASSKSLTAHEGDRQRNLDLDRQRRNNWNVGLKPDYLPLSLELLLPGHPLLEEDFYLKVGGRFVLLRKRELPLTEKRIKRWREMGVKAVYLRAETRDQYLNYLLSRLDEAMAETSSPEQKAGYLYGLAELVVDKVTTEFNEETMELGNRFARDLVKHLIEQPDLSGHVLKMMSHDFYTYVHSNNVLFLSSSFALAQGLGPKEVEKIALGALFHDLGKERVDPRILRKPGKLDPYEWAEVRRHPLWSDEMLRMAKLLNTEEVRRIALEHHEAYDATGYPRGIDRDLMHPYSMLVKICDVFEALCGIRPYREPLTPYKALELMKEDMRKKLDLEMFKAFVSFLGPEYYRRLMKKD